MTQEQKAKAYDEALERARIINNGEDVDIEAGTTTCEYIFPELKESDEKIREELTEFFKMASGGFLDTTIQCKKFGKWLTWLEKQGEKLQGKSALEAAKEDKVDSQNCVNPADKIKPKFKVGDWITNDYCAGKVIELTNDAYLLDTGQGIPFSCEHNVHLWTIQDAKDGDVLVASDDSVFIYAGSTDRHAQFYIALSKYGDFNTEGGNWEDKDCVKPATKEQRDTLMKAMADAGWKFDFEKKELKKICVIDEGKAEMDYCFTKMMNGEKVSSAWSKEDEQIILSIEQVMNCASLLNIVPEKIDKIRTWLKSLKERIGG